MPVLVVAPVASRQYDRVCLFWKSTGRLCGDRFVPVEEEEADLRLDGGVGLVARELDEGARARRQA